MIKAKRTILIIDDDLIQIKTAEKLLVNDGYTVVFALNGRDGLSLAKEIKPDAILLDVLMPDIDGVDVALDLRRDPIMRDIPVIFMTVTIPLELDQGHQQIDIEGQSYRGFAKPLHNARLLNTLRKAINVRENNN